MEILKIKIQTRNSNIHSWTDRGGTIEIKDPYEEHTVFLDREEIKSNRGGIYYYKNYTYKLVKKSLTHAQHVNNASENGGWSVVSITDQEENKFILEICENNDLILGATRYGSNKTNPGPETWRWDDGTTWEYTNWYSNEPNNSGNEPRVNFYSKKNSNSALWGKWNDTKSTTKLYSVYKKKTSIDEPYLFFHKYLRITVLETHNLKRENNYPSTREDRKFNKSDGYSRQYWQSSVSQIVNSYTFDIETGGLEIMELHFLIFITKTTISYNKRYGNNFL